MTPSQKIKHSILLLAECWGNIALPEVYVVNGENVDKLYEENDRDGNLQDARNEIRSSGTETGLSCEWSNHYDSDAVAAQMHDGSWVGWTYWHGGGKHGQPESIEWIDDAYALDCKEEQVTVTQRTFTKA